MKTDADLGQHVHEFLLLKGVETPTIDIHNPGRENRINMIASQFSVIMDLLGLDRRDDSLADSPTRVAKMYVDEVFRGLDYGNFPKCTVVDNKFQYDEMVLVKDISCLSVCEHHFVTIDMKVHIAYIPDKNVLGLSKINRVAKFFAQRPQVQERYTEQVAFALSHILQTPHVAVVVDGKHYCVIQRGVEDTNSSTVTSKLLGGFKTDPALRAEFMSLIK